MGTDKSHNDREYNIVNNYSKFKFINYLVNAD